jgi:hypothetical protein
MAITTVFEKLGRAIFETPFGANRVSKDAPELAEIRLAMLDAVKARSHRASGKNVFPYNVVRIRLRGIPPAQQASVLQGDFLASYFAQELKRWLSRSTYRFPEDLRVEIRTTPVLPGEGEDWISVETESHKSNGGDGAGRARRPARLVVVQGTANQDELFIDKVRTNIGRTAEVYGSAGPSRHNDLAFTEDSETNRSVSREHAHILFSPKTGEYRLFNDRSYKGETSCGLWIVRDGLSQPVHRGTRGTLLKPGDEIHLGTAVVRFQVGQKGLASS